MDIFSIVKKAKQTADVWVTEGLFKEDYRLYFEESFVCARSGIHLERCRAWLKDASALPAKNYVAYIYWLGYKAGKEAVNDNIPNPTTPTEETGEWGDIAIESPIPIPSPTNPTNPTEETSEWEDIAVEV